jgi:hypothetical protein
MIVILVAGRNGYGPSRPLLEREYAKSFTELTLPSMKRDGAARNPLLTRR